MATQACTPCSACQDVLDSVAGLRARLATPEPAAALALLRELADWWARGIAVAHDSPLALTVRDLVANAALATPPEVQG